MNAAGVPAQRLPFEMMTLYELVSAMQSTTVCQPLSAEFAFGLTECAWWHSRSRFSLRQL